MQEEQLYTEVCAQVEEYDMSSVTINTVLRRAMITVKSGKPTIRIGVDSKREFVISEIGTGADAGISNGVGYDPATMSEEQLDAAIVGIDSSVEETICEMKDTIRASLKITDCDDDRLLELANMLIDGGYTSADLITD